MCFKLPIERRSTNKGKNSFFILWNVHRQLMCLLFLSSHPLIVYKTGSLVAKEETDLVGSNHKGISYKTAERFRLIFVNFRWESLAEEALFTYLLFRACDLGGTEIACSCMLIYRVNSTHRKWKSSLRLFFFSHACFLTLFEHKSRGTMSQISRHKRPQPIWNKGLSKHVVNWHWPRDRVALNNLHSEYHFGTHVV